MFNDWSLVARNHCSSCLSRIMWIDADALVINDHFKLENLIHHSNDPGNDESNLIIAEDSTGINTGIVAFQCQTICIFSLFVLSIQGVFLLRSCPTALEFLQQIYQYGSVRLFRSAEPHTGGFSFHEMETTTHRNIQKLCSLIHGKRKHSRPWSHITT